jgi:hypothetical protein
MEKYLKDLNKIDNIEGYGLINKYNVPMKSGKIIHYIVDWTFLSGKEVKPIDLVSDLYNSVSGTPRIYVDNTMDFVRWITARKAELAQKKKKNNSYPPTPRLLSIPTLTAQYHLRLSHSATPQSVLHF